MIENARPPITKIEGARRQLDCAIRLFFEDDDSLAIHTLAHAAFKVLFDLYPKRRSDDFATQMNNRIARLGWRRFSREPNFLKHADKDPEEELSNHSAEYVQATIGLAAILHHRITGQMTPKMRAFDAWVQVLNPDHFELPQDPDPEIDAAFRDSVALLQGGTWESRLSTGKVLLTYYREHPEVGGFGGPRAPEDDG
jgi:hypothetical protein